MYRGSVLTLDDNGTAKHENREWECMFWPAMVRFRHVRQFKFTDVLHTIQETNALEFDSFLATTDSMSDLQPRVKAVSRANWEKLSRAEQRAELSQTSLLIAGKSDSIRLLPNIKDFADRAAWENEFDMRFPRHVTGVLRHS